MPSILLLIQLTVEEATLYFGASNSDFATPLNNGPTYSIEDTAKNIVDGENNGSEARSGIFNASEVVANGIGPDLTVAETKSDTRTWKFCWYKRCGCIRIVR